MTTPTAPGLSWVLSRTAICRVRRSYSCGSWANKSTALARSRQADDAVAGQVTDVDDADERQQVRFAHRPDRDIAGDHEFVVPLVVVERGEGELAGSQQFGVSTRHPGGCLGQPAGCRVDAEGGEEGGDGAFRGDEIPVGSSFDRRARQRWSRCSLPAAVRRSDGH